MTLLPENLKEVLQKGLPIQELHSRYWYQYLIKPDTAIFTFDGETVEELVLHAKKYDDSHAKYFQTVCAWVAVNNYETFVEWISLEIPEVINLFANEFTIFSGLMILWSHNSVSEDRIWPENIYKLVQKLFDDLLSLNKNFDHQNLWSACLEQAVLHRDSGRVEYLIDILESVNTQNDDKIVIKKRAFRWNSWKHGDVFIEIYPKLDISLLDFDDVVNLKIRRHMIQNGYEVTNENLLFVLNHSYYFSKADKYDYSKINELFLECFHFANQTQEFIDKCFRISIERGNVQIFDFLFENHNPDLNRIDKLDYDFCGIEHQNLHYLPMAIWHNKLEIVTKLLNYINLNEISDEVTQHIVEILIITRNQKFGLKFVDQLNLSSALSSSCKEFVIHFNEKNSYKYNIDRDLILFMSKIGCSFDDNYFNEILEFVDIEALDFLMKMLNITLDDVPINIIVNIVERYSKIFNTIVENVKERINKHKKTQYATTSLKTKLIELEIEYGKHPIYYLSAIGSVNEYGGIFTLKSKIDIHLFERLFKFCLCQNVELQCPNLFDDADKITKHFTQTINKCYDHNDLNKNGGKIPKEIIWDSNSNET
jgi:hypothetical protein